MDHQVSLRMIDPGLTPKEKTYSWLHISVITMQIYVCGIAKTAVPLNEF